MAPYEVRVGTDIEMIADVGRAVRTFGPRYVDRLFTSEEIDSSGGSGPLAIPGLTARFAAKEAFFKVLRTPDLIPPWTSVEVVRYSGGWTGLRLFGRARAMSEQAGISQLTVSLSHAAEFGMATVVAVIDSPFPTATEPVSDQVTGVRMDESIRRVLSQHGQMKADVTTLSEDGDLYRAGLTSHASINVMLALEDTFDIEFPDDLLRKSTFESIEAIRRTLVELGASGAVQ